VRGRGGRIDPLDTEAELTKGRRDPSQREDRRANVVNEPWQRQFGRAHAPADRFRSLVHDDIETGLREDDRGREPIRARADHDGAFLTQPTPASRKARFSLSISRAITSR
jgi:hypothetical protein